MSAPHRLLGYLALLSFVAAVTACLLLAPEAPIAAHWDGAGRPDAWLGRNLALTHVPALMLGFSLLGWLHRGRAWSCTLCGAATALAAYFTYALGLAAGLGELALVGPVGVGALFVYTWLGDLWRQLDGADSDDVRDG